MIFKVCSKLSRLVIMHCALAFIVFQILTEMDSLHRN